MNQHTTRMIEELTENAEEHGRACLQDMALAITGQDDYAGPLDAGELAYVARQVYVQAKLAGGYARLVQQARDGSEDAPGKARDCGVCGIPIFSQVAVLCPSCETDGRR